MSFWKPDPTFYASPRDAIAAPPEKLAYVAAFSRPADQPDAIAVLDTDESSGTYVTVVGGYETEGPGGVALLDHTSFEVLGRWEVDRSDQYQMPLELRPAHDPTKQYGFVGVVISVEGLSASVWLWHKENLDRVWAVALVGAGTATAVAALV